MTPTVTQRAAAELVVFGLAHPEHEEWAHRTAACLLAPIETTGADAMPRASAAEVDSWRS